jgi:hypothetical protein
MLCYEIKIFSSKFPMISENMLDNIRLFQNLLDSIVHKNDDYFLVASE